MTEREIEKDIEKDIEIEIEIEIERGKWGQKRWDKERMIMPHVEEF
jgi:hypothetical protein